MNSYELTRSFIDFSFENPTKIKPNHYALYFFSIEHCNRLGWKDVFGLPTTMSMEAIGIKSYNTYIKTFNELSEYGFYEVIERSKNQYSSNIIKLSNFDKALDKALDKAFIKHGTKQKESTEQSIDSIIKQLTNLPINQLTNKQLKDLQKIITTNENNQVAEKDKPKTFKNWDLEDFKKSVREANREHQQKDNVLIAFHEYWTEPSASGRMKFTMEKTWKTSSRMKTWINNLEKWK